MVDVSVLFCQRIATTNIPRFKFRTRNIPDGTFVMTSLKNFTSHLESRQWLLMPVLNLFLIFTTYNVIWGKVYWMVLLIPLEFIENWAPITDWDIRSIDSWEARKRTLRIYTLLCCTCFRTGTPSMLLYFSYARILNKGNPVFFLASKASIFLCVKTLLGSPK